MKKTIIDLFEASVKRYPNNTFLLEKTSKVFEPTTYTQVKEQVYRLGAGLQALGVKKGDCMALLSEVATCGLSVNLLCSTQVL